MIPVESTGGLHPELLTLLADCGLVLPRDTTGRNLQDRLVVACYALRKEKPEMFRRDDNHDPEFMDDMGFQAGEGLEPSQQTPAVALSDCVVGPRLRHEVPNTLAAATRRHIPLNRRDRETIDGINQALRRR